MPKFLEAKQKAEYGAKYKVPYKILNKLGVMKGNKITAKGEAMEAKHEQKAPSITATVKNYSFHRPVRKVQVRHYK